MIKRIRQRYAKTMIGRSVVASVLLICLVLDVAPASAKETELQRDWQHAIERGTKLMEFREYKEAEALYRNLLPFSRQFGEEVPKMQINLVDLAQALVRQHKIAEAELYFAKSMHILKDKKGELDPLLVESLSNLADAYEHESFNQLSESCVIHCVQLRQIADPDHIRLSNNFQTLGLTYFNKKRYAEAELMLRFAVKQLDMKWGANNKSKLLVAPLQNLAAAEEKLKNYDAAQVSLNRALAIENDTAANYSVHEERAAASRKSIEAKLSKLAEEKKAQSKPNSK